jgi:hypothetical protein
VRLANLLLLDLACPKAHLTMRGLSLSFICWNSLPPIERFQWLAGHQRKSTFAHAEFVPIQGGESGPRRKLGLTVIRFWKNIIGAAPEPRDQQLCSLQKKQNTGRRIWQENVGSSENSAGRQ